MGTWLLSPPEGLDDGWTIVAKLNGRAKRLRLRVDSKDHRFVVTIPRQAYLIQAQTFVDHSKEWILNAVQRYPRSRPFASGQVVPVLGDAYQVLHKEAPRPHIWIDDQKIPAVLTVHCPQDALSEAIKQWIRSKALSYFQKQSDCFAQTLDLSIKDVQVRDLKSRWGSCSEESVLRYNWRLVFAPLEICQYICAHEVSHLIEMNHSADFWRIVRQLDPFYKVHRQWLRDNGHSLFRFGSPR